MVAPISGVLKRARHSYLFTMKLLIACGVVLLSGNLARAETCPAPEGSPQLATIDADTRLVFILHAMDEEKAKLQTWSLIWGTTYAATTVAQVVIIPFVQPSVRIDLTVGASAAAFGSLTLYLLPLRITSQTAPAHEDASDPDRCLALAKVEARFFKTAEIDYWSASWIAHAGNVVINAGVALILGVGFGHWEVAALAGGIGVTVGEVNLLTQPHVLMSAERSYRQGVVTGSDVTTVLPRVGLLAVPAGAGGQLTWAW
jgi:hypothetical protein